MRLRFRAAMFHRTQQLGIDPSQPRQCLGIQAIVLLSTLSDQAHVAGVGHDDLVSDFTQQTAHPRRVHSRFQREAAARHSAEHFAQSFGSRAHLLLKQHPASFVEYEVPAAAIPQIQPDG